MATDINITFKKKEFNTAVDSYEGCVVFDTVTKKIFVAGVPYGSDVKDAVWNDTTKTLTITKADTTQFSLNFTDGDLSTAPTSLLAGLRENVNTNTNAITTLNGTGDGSVSKTIATALTLINGSASVASKSNDIVSIKTSVEQNNSYIGDGDTSIDLAKVASTGNSSDVSVTYSGSTSNVQTSITDIDSRLTTLANRQMEYILPSSNNTCPSGYVHYYSGSSYFTGSLEASASTMNKVYVCKTTQNGAYVQIITAKTTNTYYWVEIGTQEIDLSGYIKTVTVNGKNYQTTASGTVVNLGEGVTSVSGENDITGGNVNFVSVTAESTTTDGSKNVTLASKAKVQDISTATTVNDGLASAYNVQENINNSLTTFRSWTDADMV